SIRWPNIGSGLQVQRSVPRRNTRSRRLASNSSPRGALLAFHIPDPMDVTCITFCTISTRTRVATPILPMALSLNFEAACILQEELPSTVKRAHRVDQNTIPTMSQFSRYRVDLCVAAIIGTLPNSFSIAKGYQAKIDRNHSSSRSWACHRGGICFGTPRVEASPQSFKFGGCAPCL